VSRPAAHTDRRLKGGERIFADDAGRLWGATPVRGADEAVVFSCISDSRQKARAIALDHTYELADVNDETLRDWLRAAPRMGRLI
jgi:hypothetical protein